MKRLLLFAILHFLSHIALCSNVIDSLENSLENEKNLIKRIEILHELSWQNAGLDNQKSLYYAQKSLDFSLQTTNKELVATSYNRLGLAYDFMSEFNEALKYYNACLQIREELGSSKDISAVLNNIGGVYYYKGDFDTALDYYYRALNLREEYLRKSKDKTEAEVLIGQSYNNIAMALKVQANFAEAIEYYQRAIFIKSKNGDKKGICTSKSNIGALYHEMGEPDSALFYLKDALSLAEDLEIDFSITMIKNNLGLVYMDRGDFARAESIYLDLIIHERKMGRRLKEATANINLASIYLRQEKFGKAIEFAGLALSIGKDIESLIVQQNAYQLLYFANKGKDNFKKAFEFYNLFTEIKDSLFNLETAAKTNELHISYETQKKQDSIQLLNIENELLAKNSILDKQEIKNRKRLAYFLSGGLILVILTSFLFILNVRMKKKVIETEAELRNENFQKEIELLRTRLENTLEERPRSNLAVDQKKINESLVNPLTEREIEVLTKVADGKSNKEIAEELFVSINTIKTHVLNIYEKLDVQNRTQAAVKAGTLNILKYQV